MRMATSVRMENSLHSAGVGSEARNELLGEPLMEKVDAMMLAAVAPLWILSVVFFDPLEMIRDAFSTRFWWGCNASLVVVLTELHAVKTCQDS